MYPNRLQQTVQYRTYIKETIVEALREVFAAHPDPLIRNTKVTPELPTDRAQYPTVIVRYYNRSFRNAGVGHHEWILATPEGYEPKLYQKFRHFMYNGDIELKILAMSSKDRDYLADAIVQTVGMAEAEHYTKAFLDRVYNSDVEAEPQSRYHFINLSTDEFSELGDQEGPAPWMEEDLLVYSSTFRIPIFGEFYSRLLTDQTSYGFVQKVEIYPWIPVLEEEPNPNPEDESPWLSSEDVRLG
jgi:hypothetical protein